MSRLHPKTRRRNLSLHTDETFAYSTSAVRWRKRSPEANVGGAGTLPWSTLCSKLPTGTRRNYSTGPRLGAGELDELRRRSAEPGWWQDYGDILSEPVEMLIELEVEAPWIRGYEGHVIPGLLQTRDYAERIMTAGAMHIRVADIDRYLELRMRRQVGGPEVLRAQLRHITRAVREFDVTVQVVPFTADEL
ncbi:MAG: Scr1 family TA system antitoxin-like transcriptional regulator [Pseudonocardiaceae bacterium]